MDVGSNKSRKDTRAVVSLVARYRSPSTFEYVQEACCDVSVGGMFIKSADPAAAGTLLKLECEADNGTEKIRGVARVVWLRRDANEYGPSGMGVKFVKLEPGSKETITRIVQELSAAGVEAQSVSSAPESRGKPPGVHAASARLVVQPATQAAVVAVTVEAPSAAPVQPAEPALASAAPLLERAAEAGAVDMRTSAPPAAPVSDGIAYDNPPARSSLVQPQLVDAAPRSAIETRSSLPPSERPPAPTPSGGLRIGWLVAVALAAVLIYLLARRETHILSDTHLTDQTAPAVPDPGAASAQPSAAEPEPAAPAAMANEAPTAAEPAPSAPAAQEAPAAQPARADAPEQDPAAQNKPAEPPAAAADTSPTEPAASDRKPEAPAAAMPAADAKPPTAAERAAASTPPSAAAPAHAAIPADRPPLAEGQLPYIMSFITRPTGATVTIGAQTVVAPGDMDLGAMPPRVKVTAQKEGFENSSVWLDRQTEFVKSGNAMRRRVYLTLQPLKPGAEAAKR
jgi:uncharacterized protein (TIGR02266 family)